MEYVRIHLAIRLFFDIINKAPSPKYRRYQNMEQLNTQISTTLYNQLAEQIRRDIFDGRFIRGERIPSEFELSDMYQVSRSTVRKAVSLLVKENLLVKIHGKGTFVTSSKSRLRPSTFLSFTENVTSMGKVLTTKTIRTTHGIPSEHQRQFFRLVDSEPLLIIERLRLVDGIPICVETNWFSCAFDSLTEKDLNGSLYTVLRNEYNVIPFDGNKTIELCYASPEEAVLLDVPRGCALMLVEDLVYDTQGNPLHISKQVVRGDKFKYALK